VNGSCPQLPTGVIVLYKPEKPNFENARYTGKEAVVTRYLCPNTWYAPPLPRECFIKFDSGITLLVPENDIVLPE
jgi:hypothetical protein